MSSVKDLFKRYKIIFIVITLIIFAALIVSIPSLAKLKNRNTIYNVSSWDGSIAKSYKNGDGSKENPYIISNGSEFAFFAKQLENPNFNYEGVYFELSNDIIINPGIFEYDETEGLKYILEDITYYVKEYTNEYYDNVERAGTVVGNINTNAMISNFKGNLNGKSFTIFGLHLTDSQKENLAIFENFGGTINDLYITNSAVYGKGNIAGIAVNSNGATLNNVIYDGIVVNSSDVKVSETDIEPMFITAGQLGSSSSIILPQVSIDGYVERIKLSGEFETNNIESTNTITINGVVVENNSFEIDLTNNILSEIPVVATSTIEGNQINFSNLKYVVEYYDDITSGFVGIANNTSFNNIINKSDIYGNFVSSGIVGISNESLQIVQGYNTGNVNSLSIASGIIGSIKNNSNHTTITNVYNTGLISSTCSAGILGVVKDNTGLINITNVLNISQNYAVNNLMNSTINVVNSYSTNGLSIYSGLLNGTFVQTNLEKLYEKQFMTDILYNEFISFTDLEENSSNVWVYDSGSLPILYIDDLNDPIATINISKYSWNNLSSELNLLSITKNITFSIENISSTKPVKEKYYYVTNNRIPLSQEQLNEISTWEPYENIVTIEKSGYYVIYAKIVNENNEISYINTDILVLNVSGFKSSITMDEIVWDEYKNDLKEIYTNKGININILAQDDLLGINSVEYYISNKKLTIEELNNVNTWQQYTNYVTINTPGKYVIYAKIMNGEYSIKYINTDYILYNGYKETLSLGSLNNLYDTNYITNKSLITLSFQGSFELEYKEGYTHNLISNILLPEGTKITLIDKNNNKVYRKEINNEVDLYGYNNSCDGVSNCSKFSTYTFGIFESIGTKESKNYDESINYNKLISNENYTIIIDFKDSNLVENYYDLSFYLAIKTNTGEYLYQTLNNTISNINVYSEVNSSEIVTSHDLTSNYDKQTIYYNSNSRLDIKFLNNVTYSMINNKNIIDTTYENKKVGLLLKLYNEDNEEISKQFLDNMIFEVDGKEYFATKDNYIKINLGSALDTKEKTLTIKTKENSSGLANGIYYIKINKFISDDGYYYNSLYKDQISITVIVENQEIIVPDHSFDVEMTTNSVILDKKEENHLASFNITYFGSLIEPNVRISLYKKNDLTAYNQNYTLVNLMEYSSDSLIQAEKNRYFVDLLNPTYNLNLIPSKFENNGYKYVFELYDGENKVSQIEKYFIVR